MSWEAKRSLIMQDITHLEEALGQRCIKEEPRQSSHLRHKSKQDLQKWVLDPDFIEEPPQAVRERLAIVISEALKKKFQSQKYLEEETFRDLLHELLGLFPQQSQEVQKLTKIQDILQSLADSFSGQLKNHLKQFQSLLDAKIRKIKKKGKRAELVEFERMLAGETRMRRKNQACFINQDERGSRYAGRQLKRHDSKLDTSKRSFGTMNSASNQNESGSGKNQSGSGSKSGESNALTVLLANIDAQEQRKGPKNKQKEKEKYEFTSILNATANIRQRNNISRVTSPHQHHTEELAMKEQTHPPKEDEDKDEAFIFHHPKRNKHNRL